MSIQESIANHATGAEVSAHVADTFVAALEVTPSAPANVNIPSALDDTVYASFKRGLDLAVALPAAVLLAPLLALIAVLIRWDSKGPVLFRQTRLGLNGQPFEIVKFRTMTVLENGDVIRQASRNDTRVTRFGWFLRTFSLDELPQLLNVINGEMSVIGPRPHARAHDEMYARLLSSYTQRQSMKPGITGWAQVNGLRGETPTLDLMRARVDHDIWYVKNANIALDIEILIRTALEVFRRRNAF